MKNKTALITGITGQDGAYLSQLLLSKGYRVIGVTRDTSDFRLKNLSYLGISDKISYHKVNLLDLSNIIRIISKEKPDEIYHLAAQSSVGLSFEQPIGTLEFNIISTANLLEAVRIINPEIRFYNSSSSEMYGKVRREDLPVTERSVLHPVSPYSISKASAHWITINYREAYRLYSVCGILFNHESCLRGENFVTKKILNTAIKIKQGIATELKLGNLEIRRDWGYAPEFVKAMWLMLQQETPDDYIICSGESNSLNEFVSKVFEKLELDKEKYVKTDTLLHRPVELEVIYGDNSKAKNKLNWNYNINFDKLISLLVNDEQAYIEWVNKSKNF
ncbi:MAG TPA: GDP-mannose 4,6-dehydratase [Ignavibacteria bacterium]|nr:GDP-mannose 4,6-dehydratase [Ignavibacteria bacterium]